jgi:flagellar hook-associated protein 2
MTVSSATSTGTTTSTVPSTTTTGTTTTGASTNPAGIDWNALIESEVEAKLAPATTIETSITNNQAKISAYQQMQTLLSSLASDALPFSNSNTTSLSDSAFSARTAAITANGDISPDAVLGMTVDNGSPTGSYTLSVQQVAQEQKVAGTVVSSESDPLGYTGAFSIGLDGGTSANINVTSSMSLQDVVSAINAQENTTNVQASVVQISGNQYELVLSANQDNANIVTASTSGDDILTNLGMTDGSGSFTDQLQAAQPAIITLDGIQMTRNSNDISDVLSDTTFHL